MYVEHIKNQKGNFSHLLRECYREDGKVKKRTLQNLSKWDPILIQNFQILLKGGAAISGKLEDAFEVTRSLPYGHVRAITETMRKLKFDQLLATLPRQQRQLVKAMIVDRIIKPKSKLATARGLQTPTLSSYLAEALSLGNVDEDDLYNALDHLLEHQPTIEKKLAKRHLKKGTLVLYDITSSYFEGRTCPLARRGYSRDKKTGKLQIVFGLLCNRKGVPVAVEVFEGNTSDPSTVANQVERLRSRFKLKHVVMVGDRGMLTSARLREDIKPAGLDWITALRAPQIRQLLNEGTLQLTIFDEVSLAEVTSPSFPNERLIICRNPSLAAKRARKREELLQATEQKLDKIKAATQRKRRPLRGKGEIGVRVGRVLNKYKVGKHFTLNISEDGLAYCRREERVAAEAALDGFYVVRTTVPQRALDSEETVEAYKGLSCVEQAFRSCKTDLEVRPIGHFKEERVRSHVFLCMLAYYVIRHMREVLAPILFVDDDPEAAKARRTSIVDSAKPSERAERKATRKRTEDNFPVHSFRSLLDDLATIVRDTCQPNIEGAPIFYKTTLPTRLQKRAFELLNVKIR